MVLVARLQRALVGAMSKLIEIPLPDCGSGSAETVKDVVRTALARWYCKGDRWSGEAGFRESVWRAAQDMRVVDKEDNR